MEKLRKNRNRLEASVPSSKNTPVAAKCFISGCLKLLHLSLLTRQRHIFTALDRAEGKRGGGPILADREGLAAKIPPSRQTWSKEVLM